MRLEIGSADPKFKTLAAWPPKLQLTLGKAVWTDLTATWRFTTFFSFSCSCVPLLKSPYWISSKQGEGLKPRITKQELEHYVLEKYCIIGATHHYTKTKKICFFVCDFRGKLPTRDKQDFVIMPQKKKTIIRSLRLELILAENLIVHSWWTLCIAV